MCGCLEKTREDGYAVYKIRETAFGGGTKLSAEDGFLTVHDRTTACQQRTGRMEIEEEDAGGSRRRHEADQPSEHHGFYERVPGGRCRIISVCGQDETLAVARST